MKPYRTLGAIEPDYRPGLARRIAAWWVGVDGGELVFSLVIVGAMLLMVISSAMDFSTVADIAGVRKVAEQLLAHEREVAAECRDVCARAGLVMRSVRPAVGVQSCECGER